MLRNYLISSFRSLIRQKLTASVSIFGLFLGLLSFSFILVYIYDEVSIDSFIKPEQKLYRVGTVSTSIEGTESGSNNTVGRALPEKIRSDVPEVDKVIPIKQAYNFPIKHEEQYHNEDFLFAQKDFFSSFNYPLIEGNAERCLQQPYTIVISEHLAKKYFPEGNALGKTLIVRDSIHLQVTGIAKNIRSHIQFEGIISFDTYLAMGGNMSYWFTWDTYCYVTLKSEVSERAAEEKISLLSMQYNKEEYEHYGLHVGHELQAAQDIYLQAETGTNGPVGNAEQLYILGTIGCFILLLACINFINLSTAQNTQRIKEVGVRKVVGANRHQVLAKFLTESVLLAAIAGAFAFAIFPFLIVPAEQLIGKPLDYSVLNNPAFILIFTLFTFAVGLVAGWYPALVISKSKTLASLSGGITQKISANATRKILVVLQFFVAIILIVSTLVVFSQLQFMQNSSLGFNKDHVLVLKTNHAPQTESSLNTLANEVNTLANVKSVTNTNAVPGRDGWRGQMVDVEGSNEKSQYEVEVVTFDEHFTDAFSIKIIEGEVQTNNPYAVVINEAACRLFNLTPSESIGKKISTAGMDDGEIVAVMQDYHHHSLKNEINPILSFKSTNTYRYLAIKFNTNNYQKLINEVETAWNNQFGNYLFDYFFLDDDFNRQYEEEQKNYKVLIFFTLVALLISGIGLYSIATFIMNRKTKEIGIRKVLGASILNITFLIQREFLVLVFIALFTAIPVGWYLMELWLQDFPFRISLNISIFVYVTAFIVAFTVLTIGFQSIKAARKNPINAIKTE